MIEQSSQTLLLALVAKTTLQKMHLLLISMKEYEDMAIKIGDKVGIEIIKLDSGGI